ncbi:MAG: hypothetical protein M3M99_01970 [Actinomycetota bacterium]|nr:hypothetical protein [Actinomycetota bacterium]
MAVDRELATYLKDHLAGSSGGVSLAKQMVDTARDREAEEMSRLADDIQADQETLLTIMNRLEVPPSRIKMTGAWIGEKLGRGKLRASKPGGRVLQYESMIMGVTGKLGLWRTLDELAGKEPKLEEQELERLIGRAEDQRSRLENLHEQTVHALHERGG